MHAYFTLHTGLTKEIMPRKLDITGQKIPLENTKKVCLSLGGLFSIIGVPFLM